MMSAYSGKRFVNPLNKNIGRRTGRDFRAGKKIRVGNDGFENFDDYFSESDAEVTREYSRRYPSTIKEDSESAGIQVSCSDDEYKENQPSYSNTVSQSLPNSTLSNATCNNITSSQSLSQGDQNRSKFGWLRNRDIGRRTGKNITANKQIRIDEQGFENFDDYFSESDVSSLSSRLSVSVVKPIPRRSTISNLVVGDATPSVTSDSQGSQEDSATDNDGSQGDGTDSQTELGENSQTRSSNWEHDTHHKTTDGEIEDETFTLENNKTDSIHKHTDESEIEKVDKTEQSGHHGESSVNSETEEHKGKEEASIYQFSQSKTEIENKLVSNVTVEVQESDNDDRYNKDLDENARNSPYESDSEDTGSEKGEEESNVDKETDSDVIEKGKNNTGVRKGKRIENNTVKNLQKETRETENFTEKEIEVTNKTAGNLQTEAKELEDSDECLSEDGSRDDEEEEDSDELRPSQAHTNIDVAGNRSGSITKLNIPTSVVSFNRTRKRLSYSAGEASEESSQRNRSRIEKANAELFEMEQMPAPKEDKANLSAVSIKDKSKNAADIKVKKIWDSETNAEESNDFLCLASRSTYPKQTHNTDFHSDDEDDIEILAYEKPEVTSKNKKNKNAINKTKRQTKSTDTDSHSDSDKQKNKHVKQGSKSEIKKPESKNNRKGRRKTTHDSIKINDIALNSREGTNKLELDSENHILNADLNDEKLIVVDGDHDMTDKKNLSKESDRTVNRNRLKDKKQSNKSCNSKENLNKSKKKSKSQSDLDIADETETNNAGESLSVLNEDENISDDFEATESIHKKHVSKKGLKKANKRENSSLEFSHPVKEGRNSGKRTLRRKEIKNISKNGLSNESESDSTENHSGGKLLKKQGPISKCEANIEHVHEGKQSQDEKLANKSLKRKSSSDDCIEDNEEAEFQTKKTRKSKGTARLKGKRKKSRPKSSGSSSSDNGEGTHTANVDSNPDLGELGKKTPIVDTRLSVPLHFGSGVSFRVSRRSELLEDIGSGYFGEGHIHKEPAGALTPCISRPGGARKSKGRRVTICPEENIEHNISGNKSSDENSRSSSHFRSSMGTSGNSTSLPHPDSTPVHFAETTQTASPHTGKPEDSVIEDRLIKPSPPEEGLRRSQRTRLKPIAWYKNEQIVFDYRRRSGPAIIGVKPSLEVKWNELEKKKRMKRQLKNQIRNASRKVNEEKPYRKLSIHKQLPEDIEVGEVQESEITVFNQNLQAEAEIDCIGKRDAYKPVGPTYETPKKEDPFVITKLLDHPCMTAGKLHIKPNAEKPEQIVAGDYTVFFIEYGKILVTIHNTSFLVETGDTFMVPVGNTYSISNLRADTAKLFYTVHKQVDFSDKSADGSATELT